LDYHAAIGRRAGPGTLAVMWIDADGVVHTVALPDPTDVMTDRFRSSLDQLVSQHSDAVAESIEEEQDRFFDAEPGASYGENEYRGVAPPLGLLDKPVRSTEELRSTIASVDVRRRLDVLLALEDYVA